MNWFTPSPRPYHQQQPTNQRYTQRRQPNQFMSNGPNPNNRFQSPPNRPQLNGQKTPQVKQRITLDQINSGVQKLQLGLQLFSGFMKK